MKIPVILNNNKITLECDPGETLLSVLRKQNCLSVKSGCTRGYCGSCTVLLDDKPVASCKVPIFLARNSEIVTLEAFSKTEEYKIIVNGFKKAGITLCGYCNAGKIFTGYQIIKLKQKLSRAEIAKYLECLSPCCTDIETLTNGIIYAIKEYASKEN